MDVPCMQIQMYPFNNEGENKIQKQIFNKINIIYQDEFLLHLEALAPSQLAIAYEDTQTQTRQAVRTST